MTDFRTARPWWSRRDFLKSSAAVAAPAAPAAATLPLFLPQAPPDKVSGLIHAATLLAQLLGQGRALDSRALRSAMEAAFGASDAEGAWV
jgi:protein strawberry notch